MTRGRGHRRARMVAGPAAGFTLVELLVVIALFVLILAAGLPAFRSLLRSTEQSLAQNTLSVAVRAARDIAMRGDGQDGALVFVYESGGRVTLVPCVRVGTFDDVSSSGAIVRRDLFVPSPLFRSSTLPGGWSVRGYAPANTMDDDWYGENTDYDRDNGNWVLPETFIYDLNRQDEGRNRQTFMLRFSSVTGALVTEPGSALVVLTRPSTQDRPTSLADRWQRPDRAEDLRAWALRVIEDPSVGAARRQDLLGDESGDTVLARNVTQLAVGSEAEILADANAALGLSGSREIRANRQTGTVYKPYESGKPPEFVASDAAESINRLIEARDLQDPSFVPRVRVFLVNPLRGTLLEVTQ